MKRNLIITFALGCAVATALAQGTINFQSASTNAVVVYGGGWGGPPPPTGYGSPVGAGFVAALYGGAAGALEGALTQLGPIVPVTAGSGFIIGGGTRTNPAVAGGATGAFQIRAWSGGFASWNEVLMSGGGTNIWVGRTPVFSNPTGNPTASPPGTPAFLTGWNTPLIVVNSPEPSAGSLFALCLGSWLLFRASRKKQTCLSGVRQGGRIY